MLFIFPNICISGNIDKEYPNNTDGSALEFAEEAAAKRIVSRINPVFDVQYVTAFKRDSQGLTDDDRYLFNMIYIAPEKSRFYKHYIQWSFLIWTPEGQAKSVNDIEPSTVDVYGEKCPLKRSVHIGRCPEHRPLLYIKKQ